jgi:molybdopterin-containing oxidoreductase family membrane subunit
MSITHSAPRTRAVPPRLTPWGAVALGSAAVVALGAYAYSREVSDGMVATGLRDVGVQGGATWGLYVAFVVYFVGVSFAGITVAALVRLFNLERLRPVTRIAELLTVVALVLGALAILADLGQPLRGIVNLFRYARPQSPFFGTFSLVIAGYLFASLVYLYLDGRADAAKLAQRDTRYRRFHRWWAAGYGDTEAERVRHRKATFWLAIAIIPMLVIAHSTLGFVFGLQVGRPGWYSALQAPAFVVLAGVSGIGLLIVLAAILRRSVHVESRINLDVFTMLGKLLLGALLVYVYFMIVEMLTAGYTGSEHERRIGDAIITGEYAWIYWGATALLLLSLVALLAEAISARWRISVLVAAGAAVNIAAVAKRYLIVVPSQTKGLLLPYEDGSYSPTLSEYTVVLGLLALGVLLFAMFVRAFPIVELDDERAREEAVVDA